MTGNPSSSSQSLRLLMNVHTGVWRSPGCDRLEFQRLKIHTFDLLLIGAKATARRYVLQFLSTFSSSLCSKLFWQMVDKEVKRLIPWKSREVHTVQHTVSILLHRTA